MGMIDGLQRLWTATWVVAVAAALLLLLPMWLRRHFGAGAAYASWWLLPAALLVCVLPTPVSRQPSPAAAVFAKVRLDVVPDLAAGVAAGLTDTDDIVAMWLVATWGVGVIAMAIWLFRRQRRFVRMLGTLRHLREDLWQADIVHGLPALVGVIRPKIVLPADFEARYSADERQLMLAHERVHRGRGDHIANLVMAIFACLFWFNPLLHLVMIRFRRDQELACDAAVVARHPHARRSYGDAMLKTLLAGQEAPLGCHWSVTHPLKERLMQLKTPMPAIWLRRTGLAAVAMIVSTSAFAFWNGRSTAPVAVDGQYGARFELVATRAGKVVANAIAWVPYGQEAMFELDDDMRVSGTVQQPKAGTDISMVRARFMYRHNNRWLLDNDMSMEMAITKTPSYESTFDNGVHVVLMPRRSARPAGAGGQARTTIGTSKGE